MATTNRFAFKMRQVVRLKGKPWTVMRRSFKGEIPTYTLRHFTDHTKQTTAQQAELVAY